ncbi:lipopolysaccharide biosynthesis protein [Vibrio mediterranei]
MNSLKQSAYYAIGILMMKGVSLVMIPYITHKLSLAEYGSLEALVLLADIGTILFSFGIVDAMYRYIGTAKGTEKQQLISNCFTLSIIVCVIGGSLIGISLPWLIHALPVTFESYQIVLLLIPTMIDGAISIPLTLMRMNAMAKRFCILNVIKALVQAMMTFVLLEAGFGIDGVLISAACSSLLLLMCLLKYQWSQMGSFGYLGSSRLILSFGLPVLVGSASVYMINGLDRWFLASFVGVEQLAIYAVSAKFALILGLALQPYALWWFPNRVAILNGINGKQECADKAILGVNIAILLATVMILTAPSFVTLILPTTYQSASTLVVALLVIGVIKNAGDYLNLGCYSGNSSKAQMWIQGICATIAVIGYFVLVPIWGLLGVIAVLTIAYTARLIMLYKASQFLEFLPYCHMALLSALTISALAISTHWLLTESMSAAFQFATGIIFSILTMAGFAKFSIIPLPLDVLRKFKLIRHSAI